MAQKMGFNATWSMAVGGMVGGGIFSVLGVVIGLAGAWAWLSLTLAGIVALATGYSYIQLASRFGEGGGAFTFLRHDHLKQTAGSLSWILIMGYVLTISVYAFTFANYVCDVAHLPAWTSRPMAGAVVALLLGVNLLGVGQAAWLEIITVWGKLLVLVGLAGIGLWFFKPQHIAYADSSPGGWAGVLIGSASIFMAYQGFQLLTYDYDDIDHPQTTLKRAIISAIVVVIVVYILVALGAASLAGADQIVEHKETALAVAGQAAMGLPGKILVSVAAAFSTASAINATLFATARLSRTIADDHELPAWLDHKNSHGLPDRAVILLGVAGASLAMIGGLSDLVEAASLAFLVTFATVNALALWHGQKHRWISGGGCLLATAAGIALAIRLAITKPLALGLMLSLALIAVFARPWILRKLRPHQT